MKIKIFKNKKSFKKGGVHTSPNTIWGFVLCAAFGLTLMFFIFGAYLFIQTKQEFVLPATNENGQAPKVNKERILKVLNYFFEREKKSVEILNSPSPIVDPSL
ncbi:MAG: hypothetical protein WC870_01015 [Candidatus Paceibacterota bacterium]